MHEERKLEMRETMDESMTNAMVVDGVERLQAAAERLEKSVAWLEERQASMTGDVARIVATVDASVDARQRELERKLEDAEQQIAELKAQAASQIAAPTVVQANGRKTLPAAAAQLLAKQGIGSVDGLEAGSLDAALTGLSLEQRVAVKAQLARAGALS